MSKTELKPCPFCEGKAIMIQNTANYGSVFHFVMCIECGNRTASFRSTKTAEKKWNRRFPKDAITLTRSELDALNAYAEKIKQMQGDGE